MPVWSGSSGHDFATGDFDGDGFDDLAVTLHSGRALTISWGGPNGLTPASYPDVIADEPVSGGGELIVAVDLNQDGFDDLVLQNRRSRCVPLRSQGASRGFRRGVDQLCVAESLFTADLNQDGFEDVLGREYREGSNVRVLLSDGRGGLIEPSSFWERSPFGAYARSDAADVDGDGLPDLVFAGAYGDFWNFPDVLNRSIAVKRGVGTGEFELLNGGQGVFLGGDPRGIALRDMNGDDLADAIVAVDQRLQVFLASGGGAFEEEPSDSERFPFPGWTLTAGDFNGDGVSDFVVNPGLGGGVERRYAVFRGTASGGLEPDQDIWLNERRSDVSWPLRAGDFDGDGRLDLASLERSELTLDGDLQTQAIQFLNSCPVRVAIERERRPVAAGADEQYRVRVRNISVGHTAPSLRLYPLWNPPLWPVSGKLDTGAECELLANCSVGNLAPGEERYADITVTVREPEPGAQLPPEAPEIVRFELPADPAYAREAIRIAHGVELEVRAELIGEAVSGSEATFRVEVANVGAEPATNARITARKVILQSSSGACGSCALGTIAPGRTVARDVAIPLPLKGDPPILEVVFGARSDEYSAPLWTGEVRLTIPIQRPGVQPQNQRLLAPGLPGWSVSRDLQWEILPFNGGFKVYSTGRATQAVSGLIPGQVYSLRAVVAGNRGAKPRAALRAFDSAGTELSRAGPFDIGAPETLQTWFTAPADGVVRISLYSEINEFAVLRGEIAGVSWRLVELRPAAPKTIRVPEDHAAIQAAIEASADGDVIRVGPGIYRELLDLGDRAIRVESREGPEATILDGGRNGDGVTFAELSPRQAGIRGFTIRNSNQGVVIGGAAEAADCWISDNSVGVSASGRAVVHGNRIEYNSRALSANDSAQITDNWITNNGVEISQQVALQGEHMLFARNVVTDNLGGVRLSGAGAIRQNLIQRNVGSALVLDRQNSPLPIVVEQNLIAVGASSQGLGLFIGGLSLNFDPDLAIRNNTIVGREGGPVVRIDYSGEELQFVNNIFAARVVGASIVCESALPPQPWPNLVFNAAGTVAEGCGAGFASDGALDADPLFVDSEAGDFHLRPGSPAIDAGIDGSQPETDLSGAPRVRNGDGDCEPGVDLGAYEYQPPSFPLRSRSRAAGGC